MKSILFLTAILLQILPSLCMAAEDAPLTLEQKDIPREEARQQVLLGLQEYRYEYALKPPFPECTLFFAECFEDGKLTRRYRLAGAMHGGKPEFAKGILSLGWRPRFGELVLLNDNGFGSPGVWVSRLDLPRDVFPGLSHVVYSQTPIEERRPGTPEAARGFAVYPMVALVGNSDKRVLGHTLVRSLSTTADLLRAAEAERRRHCVVIYLYLSDSGGDPPLAFDKP